MPQCVLPLRWESIYHLSLTFILIAWQRWSFLISAASLSKSLAEDKWSQKRSEWINVWRGGTKESFMCCSSGHLTLSNYLASAFNGGVSMWDKSELTWMILKALGVRDKLTEWVLISLLRQSHSHTHTHGLAYRCDVNYPGGHTHEQMHLFAPTQAIDAFVSTRRIKTVTKFSEVKNVWRKSETS